MFRVQYAAAIIVGVLMGWVFYKLTDDLEGGGVQNRIGSLFFACTILTFNSLTAVDLCMYITYMHAYMHTHTHTHAHAHTTHIHTTYIHTQTKQAWCTRQRTGLSYELKISYCTTV